MKVRVENNFDPESDNWCFQVPSLGITGDADTREQAIEAIGFTLESANEAPVPAESEESYLCVTVQASPADSPGREHSALAHR